MKFYNQSDLFQVLVSAMCAPRLQPDAAMLAVYKDKRLARAVKSLRSKNIFLFTEGTRTSVNLNDITTIYTQPAGTRMIVVGYSDNLRYGATVQSDGAGAALKVVFPQTHRVRVVGPANLDTDRDRPLELSEDLLVAQAGASGQPRYTSTLLPVPFTIEADQQIAVDLGYDTAMSAPVAIPAQAFIFFCVKVKDRLTTEDYLAIEEVKRYIVNHSYQRGIFLNCVSLGREDVNFSTAIAGGVALCETRPANGPLLITGIGTTLNASQLTITDTGDGHSFSLNRSMRLSALNIPDSSDEPLAGVPNAAPAGAPVWAHYFDFPVSHLLRAGAQLRCDVVNGGVTAIGAAGLDAQTGNVIIFQGLTV